MSVVVWGVVFFCEFCASGGGGVGNSSLCDGVGRSGCLFVSGVGGGSWLLYVVFLQRCNLRILVGQKGNLRILVGQKGIGTEFITLSDGFTG